MHSHRKWLSLAVLLLAVLGVVGLLWNLSQVPPPTEVWKPQPDQFPLGTVLEGSRFELSVAAFTQYRPPSTPAWVVKLPGALRQVAERLQAWLLRVKSVAPWKLRVEAPPFLEVRYQVLDYAPQGARAWVELAANTSRTGKFKAPLNIRLLHRSGVVQLLQVPVELRVTARPAQLNGHLVVCTTPFNGYSTDDGKMFQSFSRISGELAGQDIQMDLVTQLPEDLAGVSCVLLGGNALAGLLAPQREGLRRFIRAGGRILLTPNAFFVPTVPCANDLLAPYGLEVEDRDAGGDVEITEIKDDPLLAGVRRLSFHRPARIKVTNANQGRILVPAPDGGGFVAVSEAPDRGAVYVLTQSLWCSWINEDAALFDNARFFQSLLIEGSRAPAHGR